MSLIPKVQDIYSSTLGWRQGIAAAAVLDKAHLTDWWVQVTWSMMGKKLSNMQEQSGSWKKLRLSYALVIRGQWHAGDGTDEDDDGNDADEISLKAFGFIQYARVSSLPFLLEQLTSHWKTSSQLSLCKRSFWRSLSTLWIMHSRLLSTFTQTFSWEGKKIQMLF